MVVRAGMEAQRGLGDQGQGALRADHQLGQVVAAGRLHEPAAGGDHLTGAEHRLDAQHVVAGHPVLDRPHAPGIGGHVATQAGRLLAGEHRVDQAVRGQGLVQLGQGHPGLDHGHVVVGVDLQDAVHPLEGDHHPLRGGDAPAGQAGARAPGGERDLFGDRRPDDGRHLSGVARPDHGPRADRRGAEGLVVGLVVAHGVADIDVGDTDDVHQQLVDHRPPPVRRPDPNLPSSVPGVGAVGGPPIRYVSPSRSIGARGKWPVAPRCVDKGEP